ncbi:hypothetical protein GPOL_c32290 [Gordonia polyisoprenivorans VH2]|uniref:Peptidase M41 domain-containing protein n=1 Tax=Gordonia polyisoprenivorans (strain DSM 44266 / VH2) TaxID=1112204 RepID=H6MXC5_GORPV|nr:hypothetical protein [Gordonia polyisoprenivorans]AFA74243.1 hypothetical protein GPOL_c32290 [Gordonia polyisoprenivorans VH2]
MTTTHTVDRAQLAVAVHEAAHAVAGFVHGREIERVRLIDGDPEHAGACEFGHHPGGVPPVAVYAGTAAELRFSLGRRPTAHDVSARLAVHRDDRAMVASAGPYDLDHARGLVDRTWPAICELAAQLYGFAEVGPGDVLRALRVPSGARADACLADLRAGRRELAAREAHRMS